MNLTDTLGWTLLHFLWQGAAVALVFALADSALRKTSAQARYAAACGAMLLMLACAVGTFAWLSPRAGSAEPGVTAWLPAAPAASAALLDTTVGTPAAARLSDYLPLVVYLWLLGVSALAVRSLGGWVVVQRFKRRGARPMDRAWEERLARLASRLGIRRAVRLRESALAEVPAVIGWLRPVVLLPASALTGLTPQQLEGLLAHELAHIRRHDYLVNLLQTAVETLLFYHPAVWWIGRRIRTERENCCDDLAVAVCGDALVYAKALARLEQLRYGAPRLAMASNRGSLLDRIQRLLKKRSAPETAGLARRGVAGLLPSWQSALPLALCMAALGIAPYVSLQNGFSQQVEEPEAAEIPAAPEAPAVVEPAAPPVTAPAPVKKPAAPLPQLAAPAPVPTAPAAPAVPPAGPLKAVPAAPVVSPPPVSPKPVPSPEPKPAAVPKPATPPAPKPAAEPKPAPVVLPKPAAPPEPAPAPGAPDAVPAPAAAPPGTAREVEIGVREGIRDGVDRSVRAGVRAGLRDGVRSALHEGVASGVREGLVGGVSEGVLDGVRAVVRENVREGVLYAAAFALQAAQATAEAATAPSSESHAGGFIDGLAAAGYRDLSAEDLIRLKTHGVTPEYARQIQAAGFQPTADDLVKLRIHGVTPEFIAECKAAGLDLDLEQLVKFRIHGVDMAAVKEMKALGYDLSPEQMVKMRIHGLTPGVARELKQLGIGDPSFEQLLKMRIHGVTPEYAAAVKQAGLQDLDLEKLIQFRIHGVDPDRIQQIEALGFKNLSADEAIKLQMHGITPEFIREVQKHGFKDLSLEKIIKLKQLGILEDPAFI
jgi:bla regulator protein blaR1